VDNAGFGAINASAHAVKEAIQNQDYKKAAVLWAQAEDVVTKVTNGVSFYNIMQTRASASSSTSKSALYLNNGGSQHLSPYHTDKLSALMNGGIKEMLRIVPQNVSWGGQSSLVFEALREDFMRPVTGIVDSLLNQTSLAVNVYSGQLDLIVDTMGRIPFLRI